MVWKSQLQKKHVIEEYTQGIQQRKKIWNEKKEGYKDSPPIWKDICKK